MSKFRMDQINSEIQKTLSEIINNDLRNPVVDHEVISVISVNTSSDLSQAKVFISIFGDEEKQKRVFEEIESSKGFIKKRLSEKMNLRNTPQLIFVHDETIAHGEKIMSILDELKKKGEL